MDKAPPSGYPQYGSDAPLAYPPPGYDTIQQPQLSPAVAAAAYPPVNAVQNPVDVPNPPPQEQSTHIVVMDTGHGYQQNESDTLTCKFSEKSIKLGFIKKAFGLLGLQLLLTAAIMCIFIFVEPIKEYLRDNSWVYITSVVLTIVITIIFGFVTKLRKIWPWNLVCLIIITLVMSTMLGSIAATMDVVEVLISVGIVTFVVAVCAALGFQRKFDFTPMFGFLLVFGSILFAFAFLSIFFYHEILMIVYSALGALLFALWLIFDIQLILGGRHKIQFDPEDYVGGSLSLYVDIIYMLLMIFFIFKAT